MHRIAGWFLDASGDYSSRFRVQRFFALFGLARRWISPPYVNPSISLCICKLFRISLWKRRKQSEKRKSLNENRASSFTRRRRERIWDSKVKIISESSLSPRFSQLPSYFFIELVVWFHIFAALYAHLTIGKLLLDICEEKTTENL